ncbi:UPF0600 protein C5orf51 [Elysia marginata]|uniref:UPF0600 protein C5orf51 n=1 Tax=Elysia marginata TaxID=1093978 RepID=A0AAV4FIC8_9GAST|nr:UPF0600 protein C5orf51 [Elysia marginata]
MASMQNADYSGSKEWLSSYCKNILSEIDIQKEKSQDDGQRGIILTVYHDKCSTLIEEITTLDPEALSFVVLSNALQKIAQLVLDFTYVEECCLVDQDFLLQAAYERVTYIIETLSSVESLTIKAAPDNNPRDVLSPSLAECIHWRKGALLYMYCHTVNSRCSREQLPVHFLQCLQTGSKHLVAMLSTRSLPLWLNIASDRMSEQEMAGAGTSDDGPDLLSQGIYSDTHLLALMYLGEMCYWYAQLSQPAVCRRASGVDLGVRDNTASSDTSPASGDVQPQPQQRDTTGTTSSSVRGLGDTQTSGISPDSTAGDDNKATGPQPSKLGIVTFDPTHSSLEQGQSLDMLRVGQLCLENYVTAAKGPMSAGGWNTDRAEEILQYFGNLSI